jgi:hypothetical protein
LAQLRHRAVDHARGSHGRAVPGVFRIGRPRAGSIAAGRRSEALERDPEFQRIIDEARASGRATLRRLQWQRANGGSDTMLIWLGKQMLGQKDKVETEATNTHHVSGAFVLGKGDPAEIAQTYRQIIDGTLGDES